MDPSQAGPDMTLSIGSPAFITHIHGDGGMVLTPPHGHTPSCSNPAGSKRKRGTSDILAAGTEVSGLSFENGPTVQCPDLGLCSSNPSPCNSDFSTGSRTSTGAIFMRGINEEGPLMSLGLGQLTELNSHGFGNSCGTSVMPGMPISVDMGMRHEFANRNSDAGNGANVLLGLGPLHCHPISNNNSRSGARKGFNGVDDNLIEKDLGMQLQLSLSSSSTVLTSEDDRVSYMSLGQGSGSTYPDTRNGSVCIELNLVADDEGSTSARTIKAGGYIPSLLMGRRVDGVPLLETEGEEPDQMNFVHQVHSAELSLGYTNMARSLDNLMVCGKTLSGPSLTADRTTKTCKFRGCGKGARGASGLCITHGGGRRCQRQGCNKGAEGRTVYCKSHGGGKRCQSLGCTKSAEGKTDYCIAHGGGRRCSYDGCTKAARGRSGLCIRHGGGKRCQREGCTKSAEGYSGLCISHGGGRRCQAEGCHKGAQGSTMFCKAHGGGKRCMIQGCTKGAEGSTPLCKGHGGGKRCMFDGGGICSKSVHGGTSFCVAHGGGKRCAVEGCTKSARGRTSYCVKHGGGKRCKFEDCTKSAQGSTDFCKAHGGGKRCSWGLEGSPYMEFVNDQTGELLKGPCDRFARGKLGLCAAHSALVQDRRVHGAGTIGSALPAGIGPGLFRGLVGGITDKGSHVVSASKDASKPSLQGSEALCEEYGPQIGAGMDSFKRGSVGPCKNRMGFVKDDDLQRARRFPEAKSAGYNAALTIAGNELAITQNQSQPLSKISSGVMVSSISDLLATGASLPNNCKDNQRVNVTSIFGGLNLVTNSSAEVSTVGNPLMGERRVLLPPQVLVPLSMQKEQFLPSHGRHNVKRTRINHIAGGSGNSDESMCEGRVQGGREERVHGGSVLPLLASGNNFKEIS
ncbi:hypothetical protein GOP47_0014049 [Adiantum capillus-veneris]|uniref:WRKY19-like zinc finger domain-containing protein n=1 Tax=Adiantum capillus-veneris TaxID=13818 RepID=A0A9D4ZDT3_ADICA|nr:hypothetical protein GOP47_0014049 [Adiantum capillus-veneris]